MSGFDNAAAVLPDRLKEALYKISDNTRKNICEIRLRVNQPLCVQIMGENRFVSRQGQAEIIPSSFSVICTKSDIERCFAAACEYSVYAYQQQINCGFITVRGGCRIGIAGTYFNNNGICSVKSVTSLNIRVAVQHKFTANEVIARYRQHGIKNTVIIGPPASSKTTMLRDIAFQLSSGRAGKMIRTAVVDERFEICAVRGGDTPFDMGCMCDIISGIKKGEGIELALRTLSPQALIFDEIGTGDELYGCSDSFSAGVYIVTSMHAFSEDDFLRRSIGNKLLQSGIFDCFVFLGRTPGEIKRIYSLEEMENAAYRDNSFKRCADYNRRRLLYKIKNGAEADRGDNGADRRNIILNPLSGNNP